jgi:acetyltransferase
VIGSFKEQWMGGYGVIKNMVNFGFSGKIHPINPSYSEVLGMRVYPDVNQVTDAIDMAIVITPSSVVPAVIEQCARKGIKAAIIISDGFAEAGKEGARLQQEVVDIAHRNGIRLIGPNTIGIVNTASGLVTTPYFTGYSRIQRGTTAYAAQTGVVGAQALPLEDYAYSISKICDFGNKCDVNEVDLLEYLADDTETEVIALHLEDIKDGQQFMDVARRVVAHKPVLILKPGRNEASTKAVASHTGSLAGNHQTYDSAFKQAGVTQLNTWQEFMEIPRAFASQPLPTGNRIAIVTLTGGIGIMAIDAAVDCGLTIAQLSSVTTDKLAKISPRLNANPIDVGQVWTIVDNYIPTLEPIIAITLADDGVDCAFIVIWVTLTSEIPAIVGMFRRLKQQTSKPMTVWVYSTKLSVREELSRELEAIGVPNYFNLETAVKALGIAARYARVKSQLNNEPG